MAASVSKPVRVGVIGVGNMGKFHISNLTNGRLPEAKLAALCDTDPAALMGIHEVPQFADSAKLIRSGLVDAVIIATPHYFHTTIGIDALQQGLHVLVEKPVSVHKADAQRLLAAHTDPKQVFAGMFNQRTNPLYLKVRQLIRNGDLGELIRVTWIITDWFRTEAYYASSAWRATWAGEGGGVLLNQCTHQLDLLQWLTGMPVKMRAQCGFGARHNIEVEDQVTAMFEYANGASGVLITSTGEAPGTNRLEIAGELGRIIVENNKLHFTRNEQSARDAIRGTQSPYQTPAVWEADIPVGDEPRQHEAITRNFIEAILYGTPLISPAAEGINAVELGNAMILSAWLDRTIEMPMDAALYERELKKRIKSSKGAGRSTVALNRNMGHAPWMGKG